MPGRVARVNGFTRVLLAVTALTSVAACMGTPDPLVNGYPLALDPPPEWVEVPEDRQDPDEVDAPVIYAAQPEKTPEDAALVVQVFFGQASSVPHAINLADGTRHESGQNYERAEPTELDVDGAEDARRLDYTYTCPDSDTACSGTAFALLAEEDLYVVRVSMREDAVAPETVERLAESLELTG
ncbi:hypothetical protein F4561_004713 [Lipingzhangella halophila]|uniref:Lipoprotein LpqN n=1 Tax=Lipingzhangella halophila TaxID=1783352 RepID=A0A7W7RLS5_9ACTN|nr:hypothetical protein [Lipingzhangella halophila]MBB4933893.1 hypothetical protein [Lipingzhangella halophila]